MDNDIKLSELYSLVAQRLNITNSEAELLVKNAIANIETPKNTLQNAFRKAKSDLAIDIPHVGVNTYGMTLADLDEKTKGILQDGGFDSLEEFMNFKLEPHIMAFHSAIDSHNPRHPATGREMPNRGKETKDNRVCRICGCTDDHACEGGCYWVVPGLCSKCAEFAPEFASVQPFGGDPYEVRINAPGTIWPAPLGGNADGQ